MRHSHPPQVIRHACQWTRNLCRVEGPSDGASHPELSSVRSWVSMPSTVMAPEEKGAATTKPGVEKPGPTVSSAMGEEQTRPAAWWLASRSARTNLVPYFTCTFCLRRLPLVILQCFRALVTDKSAFLKCCCPALGFIQISPIRYRGLRVPFCSTTAQTPLAPGVLMLCCATRVQGNQGTPLFQFFSPSQCLNVAVSTVSAHSIDKL